MIADQIVAGIDVSKLRLDVHVAPMGRVLRAANTRQGIAQLVEQLRRLGVQRRDRGRVDRDARAVGPLAGRGHRFRRGAHARGGFRRRRSA